MAKSTQAENPWVSKAHLEVALRRAADAESRLRRLLDYIDPDLLSRHGNDYVPAVEELTRG